MASAIPTNLTTAFTRLAPELEKLELRSLDPKITRKFLESGVQATTEVVAQRVRQDRSVSSAHNIKFSPSLVTAISHNHTGTRNDSNTLSYTWATYGANYTYNLKQFDNNMIAADELLLKGIQGAKNTIANGLEQACVDFLHANRQGVVSPVLTLPNATYNAGNIAYHITEGFADPIANGYTWMMSILEGLKNDNRGGEYDVFMDTASYIRYVQLGGQGIGNNVNSSVQFSMGEYSVDIIPVGSKLDAIKSALTTVPKAYMIIAQRGSYGANVWIPKQNREGVQTLVNKYGTIPMESLGISLATHEYETRADGTAGSANGHLQDVQRELQLFTDATIFKAPASTVNETPFVAVALV